MTPFAAYLPADLVGASGVIAVVAAGMYIARNIQDVGSPETRLQNQSMWAVVTYLLESLVFILVGLELPYVIRALGDYPLMSLFKEAALVCVCVVVVRMLWVVPSTFLGRMVGAWLRHRTLQLPPWRWIAFIGWTGVRGGDSLVIALALPLVTATGAPFPARAQIVFITFAVILLTLVVQGPTLAPLARWLGLPGDTDGDDEEAHARLSATEAGLRVLDRRLWPVVGSAMVVLLFVDLSGYTKGEVERIWLPFVIWILPAGAVLAAGRDRVMTGWLGLQAAAAIAVATTVKTSW